MPPLKTIAIFGATGQQGTSLINTILHSPTLSTQYRIRAITRNPTQPSALALAAKAIEVVQADASDASSLRRALHGASITFAMTLSIFHAPDARALELAQGKAIADAAVAEGLEHIIFGTLPHVSEISGGKYQKVDYFDAKAEVEAYIRGLAIGGIFYAPGWFMENFSAHLAPVWNGEMGGWEVLNFVDPGMEIPLIECSGDTGTFLAPVLADPERFVGTRLAAAEGVYTYLEIVDAMREVWGREVRYRVVEREVFARDMPPAFRERLMQMMLFIEEFGYYGPRTGAEVQRTKGVVQSEGRLMGLREYLGRHPVGGV
ncbi:NAD(P)-binding protein [Aspergillus ellipticus CBS 707.79]|uniref:NAD(P)-binding protein n=1 Tax=Aspergillus ellipticus CBS 707.79 TaxID=1448320 RepID=A0A319CX37_9EURO|nr:NAD(P)-binding protein [Aspergillus ellipticus CBS 707.79]